MDKIRDVAIFKGNSNSCKSNSVFILRLSHLQKYSIKTLDALESLQHGNLQCEAAKTNLEATCDKTLIQFHEKPGTKDATSDNWLSKRSKL